MRELTPAQRRAVMFAQQQVLKAQAAKKAKDQRQAVRERMWDEDSPSYKPTAAAEPVVAEEEPREFSLRGAIGHVLRELRTRDRRTLREVSEKAGVSLGYLSEVERGQKEASSELLSSIADALGDCGSSLPELGHLASLNPTAVRIMADGKHPVHTYAASCHCG